MLVLYVSIVISTVSQAFARIWKIVVLSTRPLELGESQGHFSVTHCQSLERPVYPIQAQNWQTILFQRITIFVGDKRVLVCFLLTTFLPNKDYSS
jgi:hypothetical protein